LKYELKDIIAAIGISVTLIVGILNLVINLRNAKKTQFINTVTAERLKWVGDIREITSKYIARISLFYYWSRQEYLFERKLISKDSYQKKNNKDMENLKLEINEMYNKLQLFLIRNDKQDDDVLNKLKILHSIQGNSDPDELNMITDDLIKLLNDVVSNEWYKVKLESKYGDLSELLQNREWVDLNEIKTISELKKWTLYKKWNEINIINKVSICLLSIVIIIFLFKV
jgi:hypothetical protein